MGAFSPDRILADAGPIPAQEPLSGTITKLLSLAQTLRALEDSDNDAARSLLGGSAAGLHLSKLPINPKP